VELADVVWSPSRYLLGWMEQHGWPRPRNVFVQPYLAPPACQVSGKRHAGEPSATAVPAVAPLSGTGPRIRELVFLGRLEVRKGRVVSGDALARRAGAAIAPDLAVTFLGGACKVHGRDAASYLRQRARRWPFRLRLLTRRDQAEALAYLRGPG